MPGSPTPHPPAHPRVRTGVAALVASLASVAPAPARAAEDAGTEWDGGFDQRSERRADVALGLSSGFALGTASGTPNEVKKIGEDRFTSSTELAPGGSLELWLGGALRDWLTIAVGAGSTALTGRDVVASGSYVGLHIDGYPLYALGGAYRDLGVSSALGFGMLNGVTAGGDEKVIAGGSMGALGVGVFWEGLRFARRFGAGPLLEYRHLYSQPAQWDSVTLGLRLSLYTGPRRSGSSPAALALARPAPRGP